MRILTVMESSGWADFHINGSLRDLGHDVVAFTYGSSVGEDYGPARQKERERKNEDLLSVTTGLLRDGGLDLIFCYVYDDFLLPEAAGRLARFGIPLVNYNVDMTTQWYRQTLTARYFSHVLCAQRANMASLARHGANVLFFPMAARPLPETSSAASDFVPHADVTFLGTALAYRQRVLSRLEQAGVQLAIYGNGWTEEAPTGTEYSLGRTLRDVVHYGPTRLRAEGLAALVGPLRSRLASVRGGRYSVKLRPSSLNGPLPAVTLEALFRRSRVNIGMTRVAGNDPDRPGRNSIKLRDFEVPAAGGFYLVERAPDYEELFVPGREVETWSTIDELTEKLSYYRRHEAQRKRIAAAGRSRALADHTWRRRFGDLFRALNIGQRERETSSS